MDSSTKQRLVGAVVLVGAIAWIVPVFLDGPDEAPATISETVELPGVAIGKTERETVRLDDRDVPDSPPPAEVVTLPTPAKKVSEDASAAVQSESQEPAEKKPEPKPITVAKTPEPRAKEPEVSKPAPKPAPKPAETPVPSDDDGLFAVQVGSFSSRENAGKLAASLRSSGVAAFLAELKTTNGAMHRVRVGPVASRAAAEKLAAELIQKGHTGQVVAHP